MGPYRILSSYSAIRRAGIEDDGSRASDAKLRLADMDRDGLHASVIYGPHLFGLPIADPDLRAAVLAGYNDWASEFNAHAPDRLCVLAVLPTDSPERATTELERVAKAGHRGAIISPWEFRCSDPAWDRLWAAAAETRLPISFHIGHGTSQVKIKAGSWEMAAFAAVGPMQLDEPLAMMVYSGALERHPGMRLVLAESGIGWLPYFVKRMDQTAEKHVKNAQDYRLKSKPSEIFQKQIYATFEEEPLGPSLLPLLVYPAIRATAANFNADLMWINTADEFSVVGDSEALVNRVAERLLGGASLMSATLKAETKAQVERTTIPASNPLNAQATRIADAIYFIATSPEFVLQR